MKRRIADALPRFLGLNDFFRKLPGKFVPVRADNAQRERLVACIGKIKGFPADVVGAATAAWMESAKLREIRKYDNGTLMARFEVQRRSGTDPHEPLEPELMELLLAVDQNIRLKHYTMVYGTGKMADGIKVTMVQQHRKPYKTRYSESWFDVASFIDRMDDDDYFIIEDVRYHRYFFQAACHRKGRALVFQTEYAIYDWSWQFCMARRPRADCLKRLVRLLETGGMAAIQDAVSWRQMNIDERNSKTKHRKDK